MSSKTENIEIWRHTIKVFTHGQYKDIIPKKARKYRSPIIIKQPQYLSTIIEVTDLDTLTYCQKLVDLRFNVVALNMASPSRPGGGVDYGSFAQEENLFRRSNYFKCLPVSFYPLKENECVYSQEVMVIKDADYKLMEKPFKMAMIACAALRHPKLDADGHYLRQSDLLQMKNKIRNIFKIAHVNQHDAIVLGSFGCGAFGNPPYEVSKLFNEVIAEEWGFGFFKHIGFGIKSFKDDNYEIFKESINLKVKDS